MKYLILFFIIIVLFTQSLYSQITLSEVMFDPAESEYLYEFVELFNLSLSDSIDLTGWSIGDGTGTDQIVTVNNNIILAPGQFAVIFDPDYFLNEKIYDALVPADALVLTINGSTFGSGGLSNSVPEKIILFDNAGDTVSSYLYSIDNLPGYSDEKIDLSKPNTPDNWANSSQFHGTPGKANSVSSMNDDVSINLSFEPETPAYQSTVTIIGIIKNQGNSPVTNLIVRFFVDVNSDSLPGLDEMIGSHFYIGDTIQPQDSLIVTTFLENVNSGFYIIISTVEFEHDLNISNNTDIRTLNVSYVLLDLVINEFMYKPFSNSTEWIELFNPTEKSIDIFNWKISDSNQSVKTLISKEHFLVQPGEYVVLTTTENIFNQFTTIPCSTFFFYNSFPSLNNTGDAMILYDLTDSVIDQVEYRSSWSDAYGVSLERIDPSAPADSSNWAASRSIPGGTPGEKNSASIQDDDLALQTLFLSDSTLNPGDAVSITAIIKNTGKNVVNQFTVRFYNDTNQDSVLENSEMITAPQIITEPILRGEQKLISFLWENIPSGVQYIYASVAYSLDQYPENNLKMVLLKVSYERQCMVINEIMFSPLSGQPEWIEIYNRSENTINLQEWKISDADTTSLVTVADKPFFIKSESFIVIAADSLVYELFPDVPAVIILKTFPSLNNDFESVYLYDLNGQMIDVVRYDAAWGGVSGFSLERINPEISSQDSSNWSSCVDAARGTPGGKNSIFIQILPTGASMSIAPNPFSPDYDAHEDVTYISYKLPMKTAFMNIKIYDIRGRLVRFLCNTQATGAEGVVIWNGSDDDGHLCRIGIYIVYLEALNAAQGIIVTHKKTIVLAAKM